MTVHRNKFPKHHWSRRIPLLWPVAIARPRWSLAVVVGIVSYAALRQLPRPIPWIGAWDAACLFFLVTTAVMALRETPQQVRLRARSMDGGAVFVLLLTLLGVASCLVAIVTGSDEVHQFAGSREMAAAVVAATVVLTWLMLQCSFALHYAHLYYGDSDTNPDQHAGGLEFPGEQQPDYLDFAYFSFVLGMTFQVSDVQIVDRGLRRLALLHGVISFFFTTVILALTINILASLGH